MGLETYTGLDAVPDTDQISTIFNKTAINTEEVYKNVRHYGCAISTRYYATPRTITVDGTGKADFPFETCVYDTGGFWNENQPTRISIPSFINYFEAFLFFQFTTDNWTLTLQGYEIVADSTAPDTATAISNFLTGTTTNDYQGAGLTTPILSASDYDYIKCRLNPDTQTQWDQTLAANIGGLTCLTVTSISNAILIVRGYK